ncbi:protein pleiotropic regulatory locus 1-like isoform X2 [Magnolia sinica]|uniref:protein pleiotropic regulatory locus 1-like isoform X2 n=1 Tax=Magnolia sinica TaxID=86752 RepID=UPI00265B3AF1|nr:protein pleiotropic regulatory locus 1-like isoform X2 [Magnolia sinica]
MPGATTAMEPVEPQSLKKLSFKSLKRALDFFSPLHSQYPPPDSESKKIRISYKLHAEYGAVRNSSTQPAQENSSTTPHEQGDQDATTPEVLGLQGSQDSRDAQKAEGRNAIIVAPTMQPKASNDAGVPGKSATGPIVSVPGTSERHQSSTAAIIERIPSKWPRPVWHAPWKNYRVISGHLGWVRSIAFDPSNTWFCTGSADRTIKIWDVATGRLKLTLTGHIEQIRGLAVSQHHTYMFSAGDDKQVKCWDLEQNKVIRSYHGHLSGVYCLALHPTIDILLTGGRDSVCRVWDIRSKTQVFALSGHDNTVCSVFTRPTDPQVVTGSHDTTIKFWDLRGGKSMLTLTHHKKSVRAMAQHPTENSFASASADNIKKFNLPRGEFLHNMLSQQKTIINSMAVNEDGVMATGGDNGSMWFWDWKSGHNFQQSQTIVQPGSLDSEAGIYALSYDVTGSRLVTCEADKTIKMWKQDEMATPETHPLNFKPPKDLHRF